MRRRERKSSSPEPFESSPAPASFEKAAATPDLREVSIHLEVLADCAEVEPECLSTPSDKHGVSEATRKKPSREGSLFQRERGSFSHQRGLQAMERTVKCKHGSVKPKCLKPAARPSMSEANARPTSALIDADRSPDLETATFAAGCFWGAEDAFAQFGETVVGYTGGTVEHPSHTQVSRGRTGHAEAVRLVFDPARTPYTELLAVFLSCHDATQHKAKSQYRSAIFVHDAAQEKAARAALAAQTGAVLTELHAAGAFWRAAEAHQHYNAKTSKDKHPRVPPGVACGVRLGMDATPCGYPVKDEDETPLTSTEPDPRRVSCGGS